MSIPDSVGVTNFMIKNKGMIAMLISTLTSIPEILVWDVVGLSYFTNEDTAVALNSSERGF